MNEKKIEDWTKEERDRLISVFEWLMEEDKIQKLRLNKKQNSNKMIVLDKDGNEIIL